MEIDVGHLSISVILHRQLHSASDETGLSFPKENTVYGNTCNLTVHVREPVNYYEVAHEKALISNPRVLVLRHIKDEQQLRRCYYGPCEITLGHLSERRRL